MPKIALMSIVKSDELSFTLQKKHIIQEVEDRVSSSCECYHCGAQCGTRNIAIDEKIFCCDGCRLVYEILNESGLCDYYKLQSHPGLSQIKSIRKDKYAYLDNEEISLKLYDFTDGNHAIITLYIPGVHCSSCMWLLEHMSRLNEGILESRLNFSSKEVTIHFVREKISLRQLVELLSTIGYEPYISLDDEGKKKEKNVNKKRIYKLGVAGFCFGNIMMLSFPEYLSDHGIEHQYESLFRMFNLILSVPVFFYSASEFFTSAWDGIKQKMLNIDAPIVLALVITYARSIYEISTGIGAGYLDSMSGITFFMLVGRVVQERTYKSISFHRDYKSYFPIAVKILEGNRAVYKSLQELKAKDIVQLHYGEIIPADSVLIKGGAHINYSFVTGESEPVNIPEGAMLYAGGKQTGAQITIQIIKPVAESYLISLWNHYAFSKNKTEKNKRESVLHTLAKYFTYVLFILAAITAIYWWVIDPSKILPSVSAMLIVACPCALLLSATYTNGNLLRIFSENGLFLRDASVIEQLGKINHVVFDKTGTLTSGSHHFMTSGHYLNQHERDMLYSVVKSSKHPYSQALSSYLGYRQELPVTSWKEYEGMGIEAEVESIKIRVGSATFVGVPAGINSSANVFIEIEGQITEFYIVSDFRKSIPEIISSLNNDYDLSVLSGDNEKQKLALQEIFDQNSELLFEQKPVEKLNYIERLQANNKKVLMVGDGLNDAGALQQSNVGITLADDINNFTPSCDAILDAKRFEFFPGLLKLARSGKNIIQFSFAISILYNIVGLTISMQGKMNPMIAAILMPASTISIVLITTGLSGIIASKFGLKGGKE